MNKTGWRILMLLCGVALLQGCVAYPVVDEPYYGGRAWDGPSHRHSRPSHEVHERGPRFTPPPPQMRQLEPRRQAAPAPRREHEYEQEREREPEHGRWDRGRSRR